MKRYSKPVYQGRRLRRMVELAEKSAEMPAREATSLPQAQRVDRRLSPETIAELVQAYRDGASTSYGDTMNSARTASSSSCTSTVWRCGTKDWSVATLLLQPSYTRAAQPWRSSATIQRPLDGIGGWGPSHGVSGLWCIRRV